MNPILDEEFDPLPTREDDELRHYDELQRWLDQEINQ